MKTEFSYRKDHELLLLLKDVSIIEDEDRSAELLKEINLRIENRQIDKFAPEIKRSDYPFSANGYEQIYPKTLKRNLYGDIFIILLMAFLTVVFIADYFNFKNIEVIIYISLGIMFFLLIIYYFRTKTGIKCPKCKKPMDVAPSLIGDYDSFFIEYCDSCKLYYVTGYSRPDYD